MNIINYFQAALKSHVFYEPTDNKYYMKFLGQNSFQKIHQNMPKVKLTHTKKIHCLFLLIYLYSHWAETITIYSQIKVWAGLVMSRGLHRQWLVVSNWWANSLHLALPAPQPKHPAASRPGSVKPTAQRRFSGSDSWTDWTSASTPTDRRWGHRPFLG